MTGATASPSPRELGALGSAIAVALVAWLYFPDAFMLSAGDVRVAVSFDESRPLDKAMLLRYAAGTMFVLVVIELACRAVLARFMWREFRARADERDRQLRMRAREFAYRAVLAGGVALIACLYVTEPPALLAAQYLLLLLFAGEFAKHVATFVLYRTSI